MDAQESNYSAWGRDPEHLDVRALRKYNALLRKLVAIGEWTVFGLTIVVVAATCAFLFFGNFENVIFTDGTNLTCILDGSTGEIVNVE